MLFTNGDTFVMIRRGIVEHLQRGDINGDQFAVYLGIHLHADYHTGVSWKMCSPYLSQLLSKSINVVSNALRELEKKGYIKRFNHRGQKTYYPILINNYRITEGVFTVAKKTVDLENICLRIEYDGKLKSGTMEITGPEEEYFIGSIQELVGLEIVTRSGDRYKVTKKRGDKKLSEEAKRFVPLAELLKTNVLMISPSAKITEKNIANWADECRLMVEQDNRTYEQIESLIPKMFIDDFWKGVTKSMGKIRKWWNEGKLDRIIKAKTGDERRATIINEIKKIGNTSKITPLEWIKKINQEFKNIDIYNWQYFYRNANIGQLEMVLEFMRKY